MRVKRLLALMLFILVSIASSSGGNPKLIFVETMFRHGHKYPDKSPDHQINRYYHQSHMPLSKLTKEGKALLFLLGKKVYQVYWKRLFGDTTYEYHLNQSKIIAKTVNFSRIIESGESFLFGLFEGLPPLTISSKQAHLISSPYVGIKAKAGYVFGRKGKGYQTIPLNIVEKCKFSPYLTRGQILRLNLRTKLADKIRNYPPFRAALQQFTKSIRLSNNSNKIIEFGHLHQLYMNEICEIGLGKKHSILMQHTQTARILNIIHTLQIHIKHYTNQIQLKTDATPLFQELIANVRNYIKDRRSPQFVVFSSQEITMGMILAALKLWTVDCILQNYQRNITNPKDCIIDFPPFGTVMAFEVYEYPDSKVTFKFNYNGRHLSLPLCGQEECDFSALQAWFEKWKVPDDQAGCLSTNEHIKEQMAKTIQPFGERQSSAGEKYFPQIESIPLETYFNNAKNN